MFYNPCLTLQPYVVGTRKKMSLLTQIYFEYPNHIIRLNNRRNLVWKNMILAISPCLAPYFTREVIHLYYRKVFLESAADDFKKHRGKHTESLEMKAYSCGRIVPPGTRYRSGHIFHPKGVIASHLF